MARSIQKSRQEAGEQAEKIGHRPGIGWREVLLPVNLERKIEPECH